MSSPDNKARIIAITDLALGDDFAAMVALFALAAQEGVALDIVASYGNRSTNDTYENALLFAEKMSKLSKQHRVETRVFYGANKAVKSHRVYTVPEEAIERHIHGNMGMDGRRKRAPHSGHRSATLYQNIQTGEQVHIVSLAAPTELLYALQQIPELAQIVSIVIMGGTLGESGNVNPHVEANFSHDPHANAEVLRIMGERKLQAVLVPLDATEHSQVLFTQEVFTQIAEGLRDKPEILDMLLKSVWPNSPYGSFYLGRQKPVSTFPYKEIQYEGVAVHDLIAVMVMLDRIHGQTLFEYAQVLIRPEKDGSIGVARTYMMPSYETTVVGNVKNPNEFWDQLTKLLQKL